jgi:hypothetical protein
VIDALLKAVKAGELNAVGLAIVEYAHRFERLSTVAPRRG